MLSLVVFIVCGALIGAVLGMLEWWAVVKSKEHLAEVVKSESVPKDIELYKPNSGTHVPVPQDRRDPRSGTVNEISQSTPTAPIARIDPTVPEGQEGLRKTLDERNRLDNARLQPRFRFAFLEADEEAPIDALEIWNDGEEVEHFSVVQYSFLEVHRSSETGSDVRYVPAYYFHDRHFSGQTSGHLVTMTTGLTLGGLGSRTMNAEVRRLEAELKEVFGPRTTVTKRLYIEIEYVDLTGVGRRANFEIKRSDDWFGRSRTDAEPVDFQLRAYGAYMNGGMVPTLPLVEIGGMPRLTGEYIKEHWERYPTSKDLEVRQEQFGAMK